MLTSEIERGCDRAILPDAGDYVIPVVYNIVTRRLPLALMKRNFGRDVGENQANFRKPQ